MNTLLLTLANMGVNLDDVADVVNNCIPQLIFFGVVVAAAIIVLIAMAVNKKLAKPTKFMVRAQSGLAVLPRLPRKALSCCRTMTTNCPSLPAAT